MHEELKHELDLDCEYCNFRCNDITKLLCHDGSEHGIKCDQWDCQFVTKGSKRGRLRGTAVYIRIFYKLYLIITTLP